METHKLFFSESTKQCSKCKEGKDKESGFHKNKSGKGGYRSICKECVRQGGQKNKEHIKEYKKQWGQNNKEYRKEYKKQGEQDNKEHIKEYKKQWGQNNKEYRKEHDKSPLEYNSKIKYRQEIELYEEVKESSNNNVMCKCAYCGEWFEPTYIQIQNRVGAVSGNIGGESRIYCSNQCKRNCPIYNQSLYHKGYKLATSREVQPELRQLVFERDNYTCQKCNIHRDNLEVGIHCHHKEGILGEPLQSADMDMCITLCADCHKKVHGMDGCGYHEMRCAEK